MSLGLNVLGIDFESPLVLASGVWGVTGENLSSAIDNGASAVTTKSIWLEPHAGHNNPVIIATENYMMNAVGLPDGGIKKAKEEIQDYRKNTDKPLILNIIAGSIKDFEKITKSAVELQPEIIEVNVSCPNVANEFGCFFNSDHDSVAKITASVKKFSGDTPVSIKLSPNVKNIGEVAKKAEEEGADMITAINTVGPGMRINTELKSPILANKTGGISGPAIFPITIYSIWQIYQQVKIPIIATGGITTGQDAIEAMMAGASLCSLGSAIHFRGKKVFELIKKEMQEYCKENKISNLQEIVGVANQYNSKVF